MLPEVFHFEAKTVRTVVENGEPLFCAADVCAVLGYKNTSKAIADHCKDPGVTNRYIRSGDQSREVTFIDEGNLYRLIIKSRKPEAEPFERWVMETVLPSIRKTGQYSAPQIAVPQTLSEALMLAARVEGEREKLAATVKELEPKAEFHDAVLKCEEGKSVRETAKILGTGERRLFTWLREAGFLMMNNEPYQHFVDQGLFVVAVGYWKDRQENNHTYTKTLITPKGMKRIRDQMAKRSA